MTVRVLPQGRGQGAGTEFPRKGAAYFRYDRIGIAWRVPYTCRLRYAPVTCRSTFP